MRVDPVVIVIFAIFVLGLVVVGVASRGDIQRHTVHASNGDCVVIVSRSNGWNLHTLDIEECP